jgi:hypothetical protein
VQSVSARGTLDSGAVTPPVVYTCSGSDAPAFEIGAGIGARLMLTPRWGVSARVNGMARRLTSEIVDGCSEGVGSATTMTAGLGLGYDFDLD